ncbi:ferritin-like domain-containing protein [Actinomadura macra]|uniref:ferritin-like domain-containing protein n=1 Tax=Actinomadura macra TaxID=46164 RepID=UPI00082C1EBA|nr:ferritin-like domain-containing protein [Actinomadura macra]
MSPPGPHSTLVEVDAHIRSCLNWDYGRRDSRMWQLYERSKVAQWNVSTDIDWTPEVHVGSLLRPRDGLVPPTAPPGSPVSPERWNDFLWEFQVWMVSQFLHGEQGALLTTARLVEVVPDIEAKTYAAAQVADEARHVEAYARYIDEKLGVSYPINAGLEQLLRDLLAESRWDVLYLGVQVVIEGLALVATRVASTSFGDPVITSITRMIARDEARHISFGVVALDGMYQDMTSRELADRDDFLQEAVHVMSQRFLLGEVWEHLGVDVAAGRRFVRNDPRMVAFRQLLFFKVVQVLRQIGMLTPAVRDLMLAESLAQPEVFAK